MHIDEKNKVIKQLEDELHVRGVAAAAAGVQEEMEGVHVGIESEGANIRGGASQRQRGPAVPRVGIESRRAGDKVEVAERQVRRRTFPNAFSSGKQLLAALSGLRSELQCVTTQVCW